MAFIIKENDNLKKTMDEVKYLTTIGVRDMVGDILGNLVTRIVV